MKRGKRKADRIASVIELLRVAALSSYENRPISTGVVLLGTSNDPCRPRRAAAASAPSYTESTTAIKSLFRLADGVRTVFLANSEGRLLDIIDIERWATQVNRHQALQVPCAKAYQPHARATLQQGHVCAVLSPSREIKIFAEGAEIFTFRGAAWHLLDLQAKYRQWAEAVGDEALAMRIFQTALDLADAREGALFVVARDTADAVAKLVSPADRLDVPHDAAGRAGPTVTPRSARAARRAIADRSRSERAGRARIARRRDRRRSACAAAGRRRDSSPPALGRAGSRASLKARERQRRSPPAGSVRFSKSVRTASSRSSTARRSGIFRHEFLPSFRQIPNSARPGDRV